MTINPQTYLVVKIIALRIENTTNIFTGALLTVTAQIHHTVEEVMTNKTKPMR